ncbi:MAG: PmeII family type II restriction endonuclease, partial [Chloroflexota bacterium]|nr:PmeII family type II restriction endonuclease [Chloroflexota bacterium]
MSNDLLTAVQDYVEANIGAFHDKRMETVKEMPLRNVLKRKNPYLFKAKAQDATQLIRSILDAFLSSQEETLFGEFLEGVAVFV